MNKNFRKDKLALFFMNRDSLNTIPVLFQSYPSNRQYTTDKSLRLLESLKCVYHRKHSCNCICNCISNMNFRSNKNHKTQMKHLHSNQAFHFSSLIQRNSNYSTNATSSIQKRMHSTSFQRIKYVLEEKSEIQSEVESLDFEWSEMDAFKFHQFESQSQKEFEKNLLNYNVQFTEEDAIALELGGFFGLKSFYERHVQYWGSYFSDKKYKKNQSTQESIESTASEIKLETVDSSTFPIQQAKKYLETFLLSSFSISEDDSTTLMSVPLVDTTLWKDLSKDQGNINLWDVWRKSKKIETLSREERNLNLSEFATSLSNKKIHPKMKYLKWLTVQQFSQIVELPQLKELLPLIILLQASGVTEQYIQDSASNWTYFIKPSIVSEHLSSQILSNHLTHLIALYLQWGKRTGQQNRMERQIVNLCSTIFADFINTDKSIDERIILFYLDLVRERKDQRCTSVLHALIESKISSTTKAHTLKVLNELGENISKNHKILSKQVRKDALPVLIQENIITSQGKGEWSISEFYRYLKECSTNNEQPDSSIIEKYLFILSECNIDNFKKYYNYMTSISRRNVFNRLLSVLTLKGKHQEAISIFEEYCQNFTSPYFVKPNIDTIYIILQIHVLVDQNLPLAIHFLKKISHVDLQGENADQFISFLNTLYKKRRITSKEDIFNLPHSIQFYNQNLNKLQSGELMKWVDEEQETDSNLNELLYDVNAVYQFVKEHSL